MTLSADPALQVGPPDVYARRSSGPRFWAEYPTVGGAFGPVPVARPLIN